MESEVPVQGCSPLGRRRAMAPEKQPFRTPSKSSGPNVRRWPCGPPTRLPEMIGWGRRSTEPAEDWAGGGQARGRAGGGPGRPAEGPVEGRAGGEPGLAEYRAAEDRVTGPAEDRASGGPGRAGGGPSRRRTRAGPAEDLAGEGPSLRRTGRGRPVEDRVDRVGDSGSVEDPGGPGQWRTGPAGGGPGLPGWVRWRRTDGPVEDRAAEGAAAGTGAGRSDKQCDSARTPPWVAKLKPGLSAQRRRSQPAFIMIMIMKLVSVASESDFPAARAGRGEPEGASEARRRGCSEAPDLGGDTGGAGARRRRRPEARGCGPLRREEPVRASLRLCQPCRLPGQARDRLPLHTGCQMVPFTVTVPGSCHGELACDLA
jgi:hypothetical protein